MSAQGTLKNVGTNPFEPSDMKGTRHKGPGCLAFQPLGWCFGSVELVREAADDAFRAVHVLLLCDFGFLKF
jgi:hypothetical protein